jgi:acetyl-CoA acetyltransferase
MPCVASIGTYLPCWGAPTHRLAGDDEDAITLAVEAGRAARIASGTVERKVLVSRDLPLLESSNAAVLLAGLGLDPELEADEGLGGLTPADEDVAEVHDFLTGIELIRYEDLGFVERFGTYKSLEADVATIGGSLPVNPSGGLKAKDHPPGATGVAQCVELFAELRGQAVNQVDGAGVALAHNPGGPTAVSAVTILEGQANGAG